MKIRKKKVFGCKEFNKLIPVFIDDGLEGEDCRNFCNHIDICEECREEVEIQYLVQVGMERLETGQDFNLNDEFNRKIFELKRYLKYIKTGTRVLYVFEALSVVAWAALVALVLVIY